MWGNGHFCKYFPEIDKKWLGNIIPVKFFAKKHFLTLKWADGAVKAFYDKFAENVIDYIEEKKLYKKG